MVRKRLFFVVMCVALASSAAGKGKPGAQYVPRPSVAVFGGSEGQREWIQLADGDARITRVMTIPPGGAWLHGEGYLDCDSTSGIEATVTPQLGEYVPLFLAGAEGCYRSFACPWCWRLLWGGSAWPRYEQIDSKKRVFMPEGTTVITLRAIKSTARNTSLGLFVGQWNCDALESMSLSQAVDATTAAIAPPELVSSRVFLAGEDTVPLLLRFFNANGVEEYGVCPGTKIEYNWPGADPVELMTVSTPGLFVANVPVPKLPAGDHEITISATPDGTTRRYQATIKVPVMALDVYLDAKGTFKTRTPHDDLSKFVPGSDVDTGASVLITEQTGQETTLWVGPLPEGELRAEIEQVSRWPGIAMNYPLANAATTPDMDFGGGSLGPVTRTTTKNQKWASVPLVVRDYAASARVKVTMTRADGKTCLKGCSRTIWMPVDKNGNGLPDAGWLAGKVIVPDLGMAPGWDEDSSPTMPVAMPDDGRGAIGDNLTNFEEYRGFVIRGIHRRTNPFQKDFFVDGTVFAGDIAFAYPALPTATHSVFATDIQSSSQIINAHWRDLPGAHGHIDYNVFRVEDGGYHPVILGSTYCGGKGPDEPWTPIDCTSTKIYVDRIRELTGLYAGGDVLQFEKFRRNTVAHECGHGVNLYHNDSVECIMHFVADGSVAFGQLPTEFCRGIDTNVTCDSCGLPWPYLIPKTGFSETDTLRLKK